MNFKKEYKKAFSQINADEEFKKSLVDELNSEGTTRRNKSAYIGTWVAAAVIMLLVGAGYITGVMLNNHERKPESLGDNIVENTPESDVIIELDDGLLAESGIDEDYTEFDLSGLSWYGTAESDEELLEIFTSLVSGNTLKAVYCTDGEDFTDDDLMNTKELEILITQLQEAVTCDEESTDGNDRKYKAVFENGMSIKFQIFEEGYLKLEDTGTIFEITK